MMTVYPTDRQAVRALLNAIATHPDVVNAKVYYPLVTGDSTIPQKISLAACRTFAGKEFIEDGLTLAVYPPSQDMGFGRALTYKDSRLGTGQHLDTTLRLVVHLYYREATYEAPAILYSDKASEIKDIVSKIPYGRVVQFKEREMQSQPSLSAELPLDYFVAEQQLAINILPGEEILRDWMSIMRTVVRDLQTLKPFAIRNPSIQFVEYETSSRDKNIVFHSAYMLVEYAMYEPAKASFFELPTFVDKSEDHPVDPPPPPNPDVIMPPGNPEAHVTPSCPSQNALLM